jgi:hypothetical protein
VAASRSLLRFLLAHTRPADVCNVGDDVPSSVVSPGGIDSYDLAAALPAAGVDLLGTSAGVAIVCT